MAASSAASAVVAVERPGRLAGEQLGPVESDGDVGEPVLEALEGADGHPELLALGHVAHPDGERTEPEPDQRRRGQHPPLVDRVRVRGAGVVAGGEDAPVAVVEGAVGEG